MFVAASIRATRSRRSKSYARGIRNAYGFAWDDAGNLFTFSNGPDYNAPEEMDFIQQGRHYGFPFQFADWPVKAGFPYPHTPAPPAGRRVHASGGESRAGWRWFRSGDVHV